MLNEFILRWMDKSWDELVKQLVKSCKINFSNFDNPKNIHSEVLFKQKCQQLVQFLTCEYLLVFLIFFFRMDNKFTWSIYFLIWNCVYFILTITCTIKIYGAGQEILWLVGITGSVTLSSLCFCWWLDMMPKTTAVFVNISVWTVIILMWWFHTYYN